MQRFRIALLLLGLIATPRPPARADDGFLRTGTLAVSVADDFWNQKAEFRYELRTDDGETLRWVIRGQCGVPATAKSIAGNFTVTGPTASGSLRVVPGGTGPTGTTTVSFSAGRTRANNVVAGLGTNGDLLVDGLASGSVHAIFDAVGWFE